jgi:hypothetical protein
MAATDEEEVETEGPPETAEAGRRTNEAARDENPD